MKWNDEIVKTLNKYVKKGLTWSEISTALNDEYGYLDTTANSCRKAYYRYINTEFNDDDFIKNAMATRAARKKAGKEVKKTNIILDNMQSQEEFISEFKRILKSNPIKVHKPVKYLRKKSTQRTIVMHLSDTHFGSNIQNEDLGGINKYGRVEEARRLAYFTNEVAEFKVEHRDQTDLVVVLNGDIIQGVIHNIDCTVPLTTQFSQALHILVQSFSYLATKFNSVKVICLTDNHGRAMHRPEKGRHTQNRWDGYTTMMNVALRYALSGFKNISFEIPITPYFYGKIRGHDFLILHSDSVLSTGSIGKNISVGSINNKINDLSKGVGNIDVVMAGHTHIDMKTILNNGTTLLCNGSMSGIDEYALSLGITKNLPSQQLFECTDKYAVGDIRTIMLEEADSMEKLDTIIEPFKGKF